MKRLLFILLMMIFHQANASHIVGGEISYVCLGGNTYQFTISVYRDCLPPSQGGGNPAALSSDDPAFLSIYNGSSFYSFDSVFAFSSSTVPVNFSNDCVKNPPATCINKLQFKLTKTLTPSSTPYTLIYQRCCRNETVNNILNPGTTGATFSCTIPSTLCNNSAQFVNFPPQIICVNNPFVYDHSATDIDGDSLSYQFCSALAGADPNDPKPILFGGFIPNIGSVNYRSPFSSLNPLGGNPILKIDPVTGIITGTPNIQGRFVVAVCCTEWRNGVAINTTTREFQFVVTNCSKAVVANIPQFSEEANTYVVSCKTKTVKFVNISSGGFKYHWDFGVNSIATDTSNLFEPTYTYPDTGTYVVKLIVNQGSSCPDSITRIVKVYPDYKADFDYKGLLCPDVPIAFFDKSVATYNPINYWSWSFGDGNTSSLQNPSYTYTNITKDYLVTLVSGNALGCRDTASQVLKIPEVNVFAGNDTVIVQDNSIQFNATGAVNYTWTPADFLDNPNVNNPLAFYADTGRHTYVIQGITANGCFGYDTLNVVVASGPYLTIPNAFTPNGDGNNDFFKVLAAGYKQLKTFKIFNRWGELLFSTRNFREGWDGRFKGRDCEVGTYFWVITATDLSGKEQMIKGDVSLLR
jgi:gliding motility-associated-like protein